MVEPQNVFEYVELTQAALQKAASQIDQQAQAAAAATARIPGILEALQAGGLLRPTQVKVAAAALSTHAGALDALQELAAKATLRAPAEPPAAIGSPVASSSTKTAAAATAPLPANASRRRAQSDQLFVDRMQHIRDVRN